METGSNIDGGSSSKASAANAEVQQPSNAVNEAILKIMDKLNRHLNEPLKA